MKLARWKEKYDSIPEDTKDPGLMKAKKALLKKKPTRRAGFTYWNAEQFAKLQTAPPAKLASKGRLTWRWLAYLLDANPAVEPIRQVIRRRLMDFPTIEGGAETTDQDAGDAGPDGHRRRSIRRRRRAGSRRSSRRASHRGCDAETTDRAEMPPRMIRTKPASDRARRLQRADGPPDARRRAAAPATAAKAGGGKAAAAAARAVRPDHRDADRQAQAVDGLPRRASALRPVPDGLPGHRPTTTS